MMRIYTIFVVIVIGIYYLGGKVFKSKDPVDDILQYSVKNPHPEWSPKVRYWVGSYYYQRDEPQKSKQVLTELLMDYPTSQYAAPALIKLGYTAEETLDWHMAKTAAAEYIERFPKGEDISIARKRLEMFRYKHGEEVRPFPKREEE